jgi:hypothetical protein
MTTTDGPVAGPIHSEEVSVVALRAGLLFGFWAALVVAAVGLDAVLHAYDLVWVGLWLGPIGTGLIVVSFAYSLRKRGLIKVGSPHRLLRTHEALASIGALAILVHGGVHFHALLPWLAALAMMIAVASGLTGEFLLSKARNRLNDRERQLRDAGLAETEIEERLQTDALVVRGMEAWRVVHLPIAINFGVLALLHIVTAVAFW